MSPVVATIGQASTADDWVYPPLLDPQLNLIKMRTPMRRSWLEPGAIEMNPNNPGEMRFASGAILKKPVTYQFAFSNDPSMRQIQASRGVAIAPPIPLEQFLSQQFIPQVEQLGYRFEKHYPLPEIAERFREESIVSYFPQYRSQFAAIGTEWTMQDGNRAFALLVQTTLVYYDGQQSWTVMVHELQTPTSVFSSARDDFVFSQSKRQVNPQWVLASAQRTQRKLRMSKAAHDALMQRSQQAHWQRMNAIQARSGGSSSVAKTYSDILDISHSGYMNRSNIVAAGQSQTTRVIAEQSLIANPSTGETYQVPSGGSNYWVNTQGEYISSDNPNFDPRTNQQLMQQQWSRFNVLD